MIEQMKKSVIFALTWSIFAGPVTYKELVPRIYLSLTTGLYEIYTLVDLRFMAVDPFDLRC